MEVGIRGWGDSYIGKDETLWVKGVFILLVFMSHFLGYVGDDVPGIGMLRLVMRGIGQSMVVPFLFYSGFGVMEGLRTKGPEYRKTMPRKRILGTLLRFDFAVLVFACAALMLGHEIGWRQFGLSLAAWDSVGNSNWYIFVILACYGVAWGVGFLDRIYGINRIERCAWGVCAGLAGVMVALWACRPIWWCDTILAFGFGAVYSVYKEWFERVLRRAYWPVLGGLLVVYVALVFQSRMPSLCGLVGNCRAVAFAVIVVMVTMKVRLSARWLRWCGANLFALYIYQRLPMMVVKDRFSWLMEGWWAYVGMAVCLAATIVIALCIERANVLLKQNRMVLV